jgi:GAF domain-containing protein
MRNVLDLIHTAASSNEDRQVRAAKVAEAIKSVGPYRWVGIYDVDSALVSIVAWSGPGAPAYPTFPVTKGLTGSAVRQKATVIVGDVRKDERYLTAFGTTLSEIIIPILDPGEGNVIGTVDVESDLAHAFSDQDREALEQCARAALPIWT